MYDETLARKILEKLDEAFPGKLHLHELQAALQEYKHVPLNKWLSAVQALRLENKLDGKFLPDGTSIADAAALHITDRGRSQLRSGFNQDAPADNRHPDPGEPRSAYSSPLQQVRARFLDGAKEYPDLLAHWAAAEEVWTFRDGPPLEREEPADAESEHLFKDVAGSAVKLIRKVGNAEPPWHVWLDLMRKGKQGFRRRAAQTRSWRQFQIAMESGAEAANLPLTNNGSIAHVFERSAEFCDQLDSVVASAESELSPATSVLTPHPEGFATGNNGIGQENSESPESRDDVSCGEAQHPADTEHDLGEGGRLLAGVLHPSQRAWPRERTRCRVCTR